MYDNDRDDETRQEEAARLLRVRRLLIEADHTTRPKSQRTKPKTRRSKALEAAGARPYGPFGAVDELRGGGDIDDSRERQDRQEGARQVMRGGARPRAAFWPMLGETPMCGPGETGRARQFHKKIILALDAGGWTHSEQTQLTTLEKKWGARARGDDHRFVLVGNIGGRLPRTTERRVKLLGRDKGGPR